MRKKKVALITSLLLIANSFLFSFSYAEGNSQPDVCYGPSPEMALYLQFQEDILAAIGDNYLNEGRYSVSLSNDGLFSQGVLEIKNTALSIVANSAHDKLRAMTNAGSTTAVLIALSAASVLQSNIEGFGILFKDRPIVRDYKSMLDIETKITQAAYHKSQEVSLIKPFEGNLIEDLTNIIDKYKDLGLLSESSKVNSSITLSNLFLGMTYMNARMKGFIIYNSHKGNILRNYDGCRGGSENKDCNIRVQFSESAINKLTESYSGIGTFGSCNTTFSYFNNNIKKTIGNNKNNLSQARQDIKDAHVRLASSVLNIGNKSNKNRVSSKLTGRDEASNCGGMTNYEIQLMKEYRGSNRSCENNGWKDVRSLDSNKKALSQLLSSLADSSPTNTNNENPNRIANLKRQNSTAEKKLTRYTYFINGSTYNTEYDSTLEDNLKSIFSETMQDYRMSQIDAISSDLSDSLINIKVLINQVNSLNKIVGNDNTEDGLQKTLRDIIEYQCSS